MILLNWYVDFIKLLFGEKVSEDAIATLTITLFVFGVGALSKGVYDFIKEKKQRKRELKSSLKERKKSRLLFIHLCKELISFQEIIIDSFQKNVDSYGWGKSPLSNTYTTSVAELLDRIDIQEVIKSFNYFESLESNKHFTVIWDIKGRTIDFARYAVETDLKIQSKIHNWNEIREDSINNLFRHIQDFYDDSSSTYNHGYRNLKEELFSLYANFQMESQLKGRFSELEIKRKFLDKIHEIINRHNLPIYPPIITEILRAKKAYFQMEAFFEIARSQNERFRDRVKAKLEEGKLAIEAFKKLDETIE